MRNLFACMFGVAVSAMSAAPTFAASNDVTIVLSEDLDVMDPCMSSRSNIGRVILQNISETLTELDGSGGGLRPRLAQSWEAVDDLTWRFHLREGVKFTDGSSFDAEDVAYSLERATSPKLSCEIGAKYFGGIELTPKIIDAHTIDFTAKVGQPILPLLMSSLTIVPSGLSPDAFMRVPVGTGPYVFKSRAIGQNIVLTRNNDYWGEKPDVENATYIFRSDIAVRAAMVQTGEADIAPSISQEDANNSATDFSYPNSETLYLRLDNEIPPLNDRRVREALNLAIDRDAFRGTVLPKDVILASQLVPPTTMGWNPDVPVQPYDLMKAKALLAEAKADGVPVETELELVGRANMFPGSTETMEAILSMLQEAGFNASLRNFDVAEWVNMYTKPYAENRGPQLIEAQHDNAKGDPVFTMYWKYHSQGEQSTISDPTVDSLIEAATSATGEEREQLWKKVAAEVNDRILSDAVLFHMVGFSRVSERLDFKPTISTNSELQLAQIKIK
ncbi:ABC transporter substrate-binding protein [Marinobacterium rhizophilum]|uniref:ABC transporter substrate-binding protein n=1 Tax=Marinobacterium rhizophilum TaxID=420402 RepID=UPI000361575B|nr:ABC transporter substrate-binding protein [Marinobacterium rhizophilum]